MNRAQYLQKAEQTICRDRQDIHGNPESTHELIAQYWGIYLSEQLKIDVDLSAADVAVMMVLFKIARMQVNPRHNDNVVDGLGYLAIAGEIIDSELGSDELLNER
jgi:hypothetical protein